MQTDKHYIFTLLLLLAAVLTTGCASDSTDDTSRPISFSAYTYQYARQSGAKAMTSEWKADTRAGYAGNINGIANLAEQGFGVFAMSTGTAKYAAASFIPDMMYNEKVTATASTTGTTYTWNYNPLKYWPQGYMSFFAYAPYSAVTPSTGQPTEDGASGITAITTNASKDEPTVSYALSPEGQNVDLLYATNADGSAITDLSYQQPVTFYFHHALTKVGGALNSGETSGGLMVLLDVDSNGKITGGTTAATTKVTVGCILLEQVGTSNGKDVTRSVNTAATLNLHTLQLTPTATEKVGEGIDATSPVRHLLVAASSDEDAKAAGTLNDAIAEPANSGSTAISWESLPGGVTTTAVTAYQTESYPMLLIPDGTSYPVLRVTMTYYVRTQDANLEDGYSNIRHTIVKEFTIGQPAKMGTRYNLTLRIGVTSVKLDGSLDEWTVSHSTMIWDKTTQTWISGPNIIESNPSGDDEKYL